MFWVKRMMTSTMPALQENGPTPPGPVNPTRDALKAILILTLFFVTFLASMLAFALKRAALNTQLAERRRRSFANIFSLLSCFGGGVFLSTCLLDLLPDSSAAIDQAAQAGHFKVQFPLAELLVAVGFLLVLTLEQSLIFAREMHWIGSSEVERMLTAHEQLPESTAVDTVSTSSQSAVNINSANPTADVHFEPAAHSTMRAMLLVFALSLHAVFEGLSLGMVTDVNILLQIFGALSLHKSIIGFSLGMRLVQCRLRVSTVILCCLTFAGMVLVGGFFGVGLFDLVSGKGSVSQAKMVAGCCQAIACGTFLYITSFEILPHELNEAGNRPLKMLCLFLGFGLIAAFIALIPDPDAG